MEHDHTVRSKGENKSQLAPVVGVQLTGPEGTKNYLLPLALNGSAFAPNDDDTRFSSKGVGGFRRRSLARDRLPRKNLRLGLK